MGDVIKNMTDCCFKTNVAHWLQTHPWAPTHGLAPYHFVPLSGHKMVTPCPLSRIPIESLSKKKFACFLRSKIRAVKFLQIEVK
jgi:hypothetical protein